MLYIALLREIVRKCTNYCARCNKPEKVSIYHKYSEVQCVMLPALKHITFLAVYSLLHVVRNNEVNIKCYSLCDTEHIYSFVWLRI